jgi:hypothetical protein
VEVEEFFLGDSAPSAYQSQRKAKIRGDIAQRLRQVCANLSETDFQTLVDQMADRQLRAERRLSDL